jgi:hypothetical protein
LTILRLISSEIKAVEFYFFDKALQLNYKMKIISKKNESTTINEKIEKLKLMFA